ncbi:MAG: DUF1674 domain-containing protein [Arenicella sp.]|nr:DUF1674 domain-containing protein [Arenicella sp.]
MSNREKPSKAVENKQPLSVTPNDGNGSHAEGKSAKLVKPLEKEINGPKGLEPTRYGDWESKGRCYDF